MWRSVWSVTSPVRMPARRDRAAEHVPDPVDRVAVARHRVREDVGPPGNAAGVRPGRPGRIGEGQPPRLPVLRLQERQGVRRRRLPSAAPSSSPTRAPVMSASSMIARIFRGAASSSRRCSSGVRIRVRRFSTFSRLIPRAGDSISFPHSTAFARIDFSVSSSRLTRGRLQRLRAALLAVRAPLPGQPLPFELLDPMRRDLVQDERAEGPIQRLQHLPSRSALRLCSVGMVAEVDLRELRGT